MVTAAIDTGVMIVKPRSGKLEALLMGVTVVAILAVGGSLIKATQVDNFAQRLFGWQISSFYDLNPTDQAIYNALVTASEELWWIYGGRIEFPEPGKENELWPTVDELDTQYNLPPFTKDIAWEQTGKVQWQRIAAFSATGNADGNTAYYGNGGTVPAQAAAYLLVLTHVHKGATYADGAQIWIHKDASTPVPTITKTDSLVAKGWKEIVPYNGAVELERIKGSK
jgi:hypothetical protein